MIELFRLLGTIAIDNQKANNGINETVGHAESGQSKIVNAFKKIGAAVMTYFAVDRIVDFGREVVNVAAEVSAEVSAFDQIMGDYADVASAKIGRIADLTGIVDSRLTPYMTSMTAKFSGLGYSIGDATTLASDGLLIAADAAAFWDMSMDESVSHLNSFINGSYEGGEAIGLFANDTQLAAYAISQGLVSTAAEWSKLDEATKQATRLDYAQMMQEQSGVVGQAAKEADQYANTQANLNERWRQFKAQIGEPLLQNLVLPIMESLVGVVESLSGAFSDLGPVIGDIFSTLGPMVSEILVQIAPHLSSIAQSILPPLLNILMMILPAAGQICDSILPVIVQLLEMLTPVLQIVVQKLLPPLMNLLEPILGLLSPLLTLLEPILDFVVMILGPITRLIDQVLVPIISLLAQLIEKWIPGLKNELQVVTQYISTQVSVVINDIMTRFNRLKEVFQGIIDFVKNVFQGNWSAAWQSVRDIFSSIVTGITNVFKNAINGIIRAINVFIRGINNIKIPDWVPGVGGRSFNIRQIPLLAKGGVLEKGQVGFLEGTGAEAVVPLDQNRAWISKVAEDMNMAIGGNNEDIKELKELFRDFVGALPEIMQDAFATMKFDVNNREFARLVKAVN